MDASVRMHGAQAASQKVGHKHVAVGFEQSSLNQHRLHFLEQILGRKLVHRTSRDQYFEKGAQPADLMQRYQALWLGWAKLVQSLQSPTETVPCPVTPHA